MTKALLITTALLEGATGVALIASPSVPVSLLVGASIEAPVGLVLARVAGAALLSLGLECWLARSHGSSPAGRAIVAAMLLYNVAIAAVLAQANLGLGMHGVALWPAAVLHVALAAWCGACLRPR